jgi:penicillin-binding protein 1A
LDPRLVYEMTSMMQDVIKRGTGRRALKLGREDLAGKTGTTNDVRDSWFCGFQKDFVTVAWMGFDEFHPLGKGETGGRAGLGMWVDFMGAALKERPQATLDPPAGMVEVRIAKDSGNPSETGELVEWIREEFANTVQGPRPVQYAGAEGGGDIRYSAPRVIDELF